MNSLHEPKIKGQPGEDRLAATDSDSAVYRLRGRPIFLRNQSQPPGKDAAGKRKPNTNGDVKSYKAAYAIAEDLPKFKTLDLRMATADCDLGCEVKKAFELAKIAGQELNLDFRHTTFGNEAHHLRQ
jgi:hypothetical protein